MIYPKRACGYLWIRLYIASPTASAAKGTTFGHENHKIHHFCGIPWKTAEFMIFMGKCEIHVKSTPKQPSAPEAENSSNSYAFLHGSEAVRVFLEPEWWNSWNFTYFSRIPPILVKWGEFWWCLVFGGWESGFYTKYYENKVYFRYFRCLSRPYRYFSPNPTHFRWFSVKSRKWWKFGVWGGKCYFWGKRGGNSINSA